MLNKLPKKLNSNSLNTNQIVTHFPLTDFNKITYNQAKNLIKSALNYVGRTNRYLDDLIFKALGQRRDLNDFILSKKQKSNLKKILSRILHDEPPEYIIGFCYFFKVKLKVNNSVLIPRESTTILVKKVLNFIHKNKLKDATILDIGTGSGNIIIALALQLSKLQANFNFWATDISQRALVVAKKNIDTYDLNIKLFKASDSWITTMLNKVPKSPNRLIIVSNPPYIPPNQKDRVEPSTLKYEPHLALFKKGDFLFKLERDIKLAKQKHKHPKIDTFIEWSIDGQIKFLHII